MNNPYTASRDEMNALFVMAKKVQAVQTLVDLSQRYSREEIERQLTAQAGPVFDEVTASSVAFADRTENVEFVTALGLSDFYYGADTQTNISFEMRRNFNGVVATYDNLVQNIESATHIDAAITHAGSTRHFQIKRYSQERLDHTNDALLNYLDTNVIPHYGDMRGTTLIVLLQPDPAYRQTAFRFPELATALQERSAQITFDEVALFYSDASKGAETTVLHRLYPDYEILSIPTEQMLKRFRGEV